MFLFASQTTSGSVKVKIYHTFVKSRDKIQDMKRCERVFSLHTRRPQFDPRPRCYGCSDFMENCRRPGFCFVPRKQYSTGHSVAVYALDTYRLLLNIAMKPRALGHLLILFIFLFFFFFFFWGGGARANLLAEGTRWRLF